MRDFIDLSIVALSPLSGVFIQVEIDFFSVISANDICFGLLTPFTNDPLFPLIYPGPAAIIKSIENRADRERKLSVA